MDSVCSRRRFFSTESAAAAACRHIAETQGVQRSPEYCRPCDGWHLSALPGTPPHVVPGPPELPKDPAPMPASIKALVAREEFRTVSEQTAVDVGGRWVNYEDIKNLLIALDVALNGPEGNASAPALADIVGQVERVSRELNSPVLTYVKWTLEG